MARYSSYSARRRRRNKSIYIVGAVLVLGAVIFYLFRDDSPASQDVGPEGGPTGAVAAEQPKHETPKLAAEVAPSRETTPVPAEERYSQALPQAPGRQATTPAPTAASLEPSIPSPRSVPAVADVVEARPQVQDNAQAELVIKEAMAMLNARPRQVISARDKLNTTLSMDLSPAQSRTVKTTMAKLSEEWLFGPSAFSGDKLCETYNVKRGDILEVIGRQHKVPFEILMQINNIPRPESLQAGKALKIINGPFHVKVSRTTFTMDLYLQDTYVRSFKVGLGRAGYDTPTGLWRVQDGGKLIRPTWTDPDSQRVYQASDPDYPLGSRWIALDGLDGNARGRTGFAIHGTKEPDQIGMASSRGCIRMYNGECVLMYNLLFPLYSKVEVFD